MDPIDRLSETQLYSLRTLKTPEVGRTVAKVLLIIVGVFILFLFLPWQQNIRGKGKLTALNPMNRPQMVESAIAGRIVAWNIIEGDYVNAGDTLMTITEIKDKFFDPNLLDRLQEQLDAKLNSRDAKEGKIDALERQIDALNAALRAKKCGYDGVEVHGAHGYILTQFISKEINKRNDQYGGNLENRTRLLYEIIHGIRQGSGEEFIIGVRLSPERFGMNINEIQKIVDLLSKQKHGLSCFRRVKLF